MGFVDLKTTYLGLELRHPLVAGASPLSDQFQSAVELVEHGAAALVMRSLFEEQIRSDALATHHALMDTSESFGEATSFLPEPPDLQVGPDRYLEHLARVRQAVDVPVIGSLNGTTPKVLAEYARNIALAGAHALELNLYAVPIDPSTPAADVEAKQLELVQAVCENVRIPVAIKVSPFYTSLAHFAAEVQKAGAQGMVVMNRFYEPGVDLEKRELVVQHYLSSPAELGLRLRWLGILHERVGLDLAASGGVHQALDALRAILCGARVVQMVSALLAGGPSIIADARAEMIEWLDEHEYDSIETACGSLSHARGGDPAIFERVHYMRSLKTWTAH